MKELSEEKGGVEWCDREARSRQCIGHSITVFFQYVVPRWWVREANIVNALEGL
jgi:hypothetical protein